LKLVIAFLQPFMVERVTRLLRQRVSMFHVTDVRSFDSGSEEPELVHRVRFEVPINDDNALTIAELIAQTVNTGRVGDGIVLIADLNYAINVDVGRRGSEVLDY
jgi:nitrogen regulatory protein PII